MPQAQLGSHLRVRQDLLNLDKLVSDLWVPNKDYETKQKLGLKLADSDFPGIALWEEDGEHVILPRGYTPPFLSSATTLFPAWKEDVRPRWPDTQPWVFRRRLKPAQEPAAASLVDGGRDKLLCLGCGKGKTTISLWYAGARRKKTLIIVDRDFLIDQWIGEIKACYWMTREEIGLVQGQERTIGDRITVAMVHTLAQQEFDSDFYDQFGLVIVDEAHMMGAPTFSKVLPCFPGERLLLTATPERGDGLHPVFMMHAGGMQPCYTDLSRDRASSWFFLTMPPVVGVDDMARCYQRLPGLKRRDGSAVMGINRPRYDTLASKSELFNRIILDEVMKAAGKDRSVLTLGSRVEQLETLASVVGDYFPTGCITGDVKRAERKAAFKNQVLFITDRIGSRALDVPRLDTLFLLFPTDDVDFLRQTVGRIDRELENKGNPIVVVFCHEPLDRTVKAMESAVLQVDSRATIRKLRRTA